MTRRAWVGALAVCGGIVAALFVLHEAGAKAEPKALAACSVRLIRATNGDRPIRSTPLADRIGAQISRAFHWQQFWEVNRQRVVLHPDQLTHLRLSPECEVEIEPVSASVRETRIYLNGVLASRVRQNVQRHRPIINGASMDESGGWFVAVEDELEPVAVSKAGPR